MSFKELSLRQANLRLTTLRSKVRTRYNILKRIAGELENSEQYSDFLKQVNNIEIDTSYLNSIRGDALTLSLDQFTAYGEYVEDKFYYKNTYNLHNYTLISTKICHQGNVELTDLDQIFLALKKVHDYYLR